MKAIYIYKSDDGCRKGCHLVYRLYPYRQKIEERQWFSIDEPGAWFEDKWNCHVNGWPYNYVHIGCGRWVDIKGSSVRRKDGTLDQCSPYIENYNNPTMEALLEEISTW